MYKHMIYIVTTT